MAEDCSPAGAGDYVVQEGDSVVSIATAAGLLPDSVWNDPANAALKDARKNGEVLLPGDRLTVRAVQSKNVDRPTGKRHVFKRKSVPATVTIYVQDEEGAAFAGKKYELVAGSVAQSGTTGDDGKIEATIEPGCSDGELTVWLEEPGLPNPWIVPVRLGALHPVEHTIGLQQRLANLGFYPGEIDGQLGPATLAAVNAFRVTQQMTASEEIDQATRDKLVEIHKI
jgi:hypothetical protein